MLNINFDNQVNIWIWGFSDVNRYLISQGHQGHGSLGNGNLLSQTDTGARSLAISQQIMKCLSSSILSQYVRRRSLTSTLVCRPRSIFKPCSKFCQYILCKCGTSEIYFCKIYIKRCLFTIYRATFIILVSYVICSWVQNHQPINRVDGDSVATDTQSVKWSHTSIYMHCIWTYQHSVYPSM